MAEESPQPRVKTCFVVMGFGVKTDLATGSKLNLDKSYQALIKPVVEGQGIKCYRADEIPGSGSIEVPMYKELFTSDIVVADLSTANVNAFYELGIRHALRPRTTIIISEDQAVLPFDINHIRINKYTHLGESIDYFEVLRFQKLLAETIQAVLKDDLPDSPVYTFLNDLIPPELQEKVKNQVEKVREETDKGISPVSGSAVQNDPNQVTLSAITKKGEEALDKREFDIAVNYFKSALLISNAKLDDIMVTQSNAYHIHRLALATYKAEKPDKRTALLDAKKLLDKLDLERTNDTETIQLGGLVEKKLYEIGEGDAHLEHAIDMHQRCFFLLNNRYNGLNLAYLLNCRTVSSLNKTIQESIADMVWASRLRQQVLNNCEKDWTAMKNRTNVPQLAKGNEGYDFIKNQEKGDNEKKFWILVNKAEANFGLGNFIEYKKAKSQAEELDHKDWMLKGFHRQVEELGKILDKTGHLLDPAWKRG